jgi:tetratricopeptide (TPR) repeat protein
MIEPTGNSPLDEIVEDCNDLLETVNTETDPDEAPEKPEIFGAYLLRSIAYSLQGMLPEAQKDLASASAALRDIDDLGFQSEFSSKLDKITSSLEDDIQSQERPPIAASTILTIAETMEHKTVKKLVDLYLGVICRQLYAWGHVDDTIQFCERARKILPASIDALHAVEAEALDSIGKTDLALMFLKEFVQEKENLGQKVDPVTYATLAYLSASKNHIADAIKYAILAPKVTSNDVRIAKKFLEKERSPSTLRNAIDFLDAKLRHGNNYDYESRRTQVFLAELHLEVDDLDKAESLLRGAVPAFNPRSWIPFSKPLITEGYAEALLALSKLIQRRHARGERVRVMPAWDNLVIWLALVLVAAIVVGAIYGEKQMRESVLRYQATVERLRQSHQTIRELKTEVDELSQKNLATATDLQKRNDKLLREIAASRPLDVDYIPKKL